MAYVSQSQLPDEEKNKFGNTDQTTPNPIPPQTGGSSGTGASGGGTPGAAPGMGTSTQFGSDAAKLSDYLSANKEQVGEFGNKIAGDLTQGYNTAMGAVDKGYDTFNSGLNQGATPQNQDMINKATTNASDFVKDPNNVSAFRKQYDPYAGPKNFESTDDYANINNQVNQAVQKGSLVGSQAGLGSYLNNYMGTQGNTPGMQTLDTALLQRSPEASTAIKNAAAPYQNLTGYLSGKAQTADQNALGAAGKQKEFQDSFNQGKTGYETGIDTRANEMLNASPEKENWNIAMQNLNSPGSGAYQTSLTPQQLLRYGTAKPEEQSNIQALNSLAGSENTFLPSNYLDQIPKGGGYLTAMIDRINGRTPAPPTQPPIAIEPPLGGTPTAPTQPGTPSTPAAGGYNEADQSTWTIDQHPANMTWDNNYGWMQRQ